MKLKNILIVTVKDDFHAIVIQYILNKYHDVTCSLVETDSLYDKHSLNWSLETPDNSFIVDNKRTKINFAEVDVIWWRRIGIPELALKEKIDPEYLDFVKSSLYISSFGTIYTKFSGKWISNPITTTLASNKLIQLQAAKKVGFQVPATIIGNNPESVRHFVSNNDKGTIIKPLQPTYIAPIYTRIVTIEHLSSDESIMLCPAIYQELIPGKKHIRVNCFGREIYAVAMETEDLDWRVNLNKTKISTVNLEDSIKEKIFSICNELQLEMGIFDFKVTPNGQIIWLEVNPQGQFLFIEGITGIDLKSAFANFLYDQALAN